MSTPARRRLMRDFKRLQQDPPAGELTIQYWIYHIVASMKYIFLGVSGAPSDNNIMLWNAVIFGPHDTPFEVKSETHSLLFFKMQLCYLTQ